MSADASMSFDLTEAEVALLVAGLWQWLGPGRPTNELAAALGWGSVRDLIDGCKELARSIRAAENMSSLEWTQALGAAEIAFASDVFGAGYEWSTCTGLNDIETIGTLRGLQRKLVQAYGPALGRDLGTGYPRSRDAFGN